MPLGIWVIVKIMVPFSFLNTMRHMVLWPSKKAMILMKAHILPLPEDGNARFALGNASFARHDMRKASGRRRLSQQDVEGQYGGHSSGSLQ